MSDLLIFLCGALIVLYGIQEWRRHKLLKRWEGMTTKHERVLNTVHEMLHGTDHIDTDRLREAVAQGDASLADNTHNLIVYKVVDEGYSVYTCRSCGKHSRINPERPCSMCDVRDWKMCATQR